MAKPSKAQAKRPEPGPRNVAAIESARKRWAERPVRAYLKFEEGAEGHPIVASPHSDEEGHAIAMGDAFGTASSSFLNWSVNALEGVTRRGARGADATQLNGALAMVQAIAPANELEAALATQMAGCHSLAMEMLSRGNLTSDAEHLAMYGNLAVKLQRTFTAQLEALARLRGNANQSVRVEHVHVYEGGQAIVGSVSPGGGRGEAEGALRQSHAQPRNDASPPLLGQNPQGHGVPVASGEGQEKVPHARRHKPRRAKGE
jgi:hypothetical protein